MFSNIYRFALVLSLILIVVLLLSANNFSQPTSKIRPPKSEFELSHENEEIIIQTTEVSTENQLRDTLVAAKEAAISKRDKAREEKLKIEYVLYDGIIENIFFHPLIAYPERAFDNDVWSGQMDSWFITADEFEKILNSLYQNDYILINMDKAYTIKEVNGKKVFEKKSFLLPKGKKPIVITIDDLNYYDYTKNNGTVHKLILDDSNNIAEFTQFEEVDPIISYNKSIVTILENFIRRHHDFSYEGARGIIAFTGYNGILGYDTSKPSSDNYEDDIKAATGVVEKLRNMGWIFASHGYSHLDVKNTSYNSLALDSNNWDTHVRELIGPTNIYVYPYGSSLRSSDSRYKLLLDYGFDIFMGVGTQTPLNFWKNSIFTNRIPIDGYCVKGSYGDMSRFFDIKEVIDTNRPGVN